MPRMQTIPACIHYHYMDDVLLSSLTNNAGSTACSTAGVTEMGITNCAGKKSNGGSSEIFRLEDTAAKYSTPKFSHYNGKSHTQ